jgi:hypothetical protein
VAFPRRPGNAAANVKTIGTSTNYMSHQLSNNFIPSFAKTVLFQFSSKPYPSCNFRRLPFSAQKTVQAATLWRSRFPKFNVTCGLMVKTWLNSSET